MNLDAAINFSKKRVKFNKWPDAVKPYIPDFDFVFVDLSAYSKEAIKAGVFKADSLQIANLDIILVRRILNNEPVEIPLHLLPDS